MEDVYGYDRRGLDRVVSIFCMITILIKNLLALTSDDLYGILLLEITFIRKILLEIELLVSWSKYVLIY